MSTDNDSASAGEPAQQEHQLRHATLGTLGVAFFVISAAAPLTAMAGGAPVAMLLGNGPGVPAVYLLTAIVLLIFAVGYTMMSRHHISTGAFYTYITSGLRQHIGGAAAYLALMGYNAMLIELWGLFSAAASTFVAQEAGWNIPWWVYSLIGLAIVAVVRRRRVRPDGPGCGPRALFTWLTNLGTLGVIALTAATSFAVVAFSQRNRNLERNMFTTLIAPVVAGVVLIGVLAVAVANFDLLIGNTGFLTWFLPSLLVVAAIAGAASTHGRIHLLHRPIRAKRRP